MGSEGCFESKEDLDQQILRSPWAEYPLPPLHKACRDGDVQSLLYLVIQGDRLEVFRSVNEQDQFLMWTPAHWAAYFGQLECLMRLVKCGLNLDIGDGRLKQTSVHLAAFSGNALVLDWVLQNGATPDKQDSLGETAVHKAVRCGSTECLRVLHKHGASMNTVNSSLQSPWDIAYCLKRNQCLHFLKSLNGIVFRPPKRTRDVDCEEDHIKRVRNNHQDTSINVSVSSLITNGPRDSEYHQKLLTMMEANGQYPINVDQSMMDSSNMLPNHMSNGNVTHNPFTNGDVLHSKLVNSEMHHTMNGFVQHSFASNGNAGHALNSNMEHSINGHPALEMNGSMDHSTNSHPSLDMNGHGALEMNGAMEHMMNGHVEHAMNDTMQHSVNGHVNSTMELSMNGESMHMDHADHSLVNQAPQRCMMLCGHYQ